MSWFRHNFFYFSLVWVLFVPNLLLAAEHVTTISDANGNKVNVTTPYKRIISLYSAHTENLCSLGADEYLIGISKSDDYPDKILTRQRFSYREDAEKFISQRPDLVLIRPMIERSYPQFVKKLRHAGIEVISLQPKGIDEMFEYWKTLGALTDRVNEADKMIKDFSNKVLVIQGALANLGRAKKPKVYFQSIHTKSKTFAEQSIAMYVLGQAGGENVAQDARQVRKTNIAFYPKEQLLSIGSEIDVFLAQVGRMNPVSLDIIKNEPGYMAIKAVRNNNIHLIEEQLVSRPTMRIIEGIEKVASLLYPQLIQSPSHL